VHTTLAELVNGIPGAILVTPDLSDAGRIEIARIAPTAEASAPGAIFVCVRGEAIDGHDRAPEAVARGVSALIVEHQLPCDLPQIVVPNARRAIALAASLLEGNPSQSVRTVGVTGTNGKTTCAYLLQAVLGADGASAGLISTVEIIVGGHSEPATHTTPDPVSLQHLLGRMRGAGNRWCAMEVSSHALVQERVAGISFAAALFTNLTQDHLDYHHDMEEYFAAKRRLFVASADGALAPPSAANIDDPWGARLVSELGILGYGHAEGADVRVHESRDTGAGTWIRLATPRGVVELESQLRGEFNVSNIAGVIAVGEILGLAHSQTTEAIAAVTGVPGRLEPITAGQSFAVFVDYAHTPDALANVIRTVRRLVSTHRVIVVFGCGGDRDMGKRPLMGNIAAHMADVVIVTSDNPRSEDADIIIREILAGVDDASATVIVQPDRRRAIADAIQCARSGDVVLIAGKGHETGQEIAGQIYPFDDRDVARTMLMERAV